MGFLGGVSAVDVFVFFGGFPAVGDVFFGEMLNWNLLAVFHTQRNGGPGNADHCFEQFVAGEGRCGPRGPHQVCGKCSEGGDLGC